MARSPVCECYTTEMWEYAVITINKKISLTTIPLSRSTFDMLKFCFMLRKEQSKRKY